MSEQMELPTQTSGTMPPDPPAETAKKDKVREYANRKVVSYLEKYEAKILERGEEHLEQTVDQLYDLLGGYKHHITKPSFKREVQRVFEKNRRVKAAQLAQEKQVADQQERERQKKERDDRIAALRAQWDD